MVEDFTTTNFSLKWVKSNMISFLAFKFFSGMIYVQGCRPWGFRGCHGILADQLTLFQTGGRGGQIMPTKLKVAPPDFQTLLRP